MDDVILRLQNISKSFDNTPVLTDIGLDVRRGEFITLLGSSGCGKTTILRIIAGLLDADGGTVTLDGADMTGVEPERRPVNTVFQSYALFPHMTVQQNVGYALRLRGESKAKIRDEVARVLSLVQLPGYEKRMPHELSGGQRQRVAIARAVIAEPKVLLLDEPLGALDLQLRRQMQTELKHIQKKLGITFIYITHDQEEALNMSSRIAVMRNGVFEQIGTPSCVYDSPRTAYVARFVGEANIIHGTAVDCGGDHIGIGAYGAVLSAKRNGVNIAPGDKVCVAVRRESIIISEGGNGGIPAVVSEKSFAGGMLRITLNAVCGGSEDEELEIIASRHGIDSPLKGGDRVFVSWNPEQAVAVVEDAI